MNDLFERKEFLIVDTVDPHIRRRKDILSAHPEVKSLFGPNPYSGLLVLCLVTLQLLLAFLLRNQGLTLIFLTAYCIGAFVAASLYSLIHDTSHGLIFRKKQHNRLIAILANVPIVMLSAETFRRHHRYHHSQMGDYRHDVGIPTRQEANWVGRSSFRKALWLTFFSIFQALRISKAPKKTPFWDTWMALNLLIQLLANGLILWFFGPASLCYLALSVFFAFGPHPAGARVIQEHFIVLPGQETNNYTGPGNILECNFGYHTEHHDFSCIPWNRLPKVRQIAPEYYSSLHAFPSRTKLIFDFVFNKDWHLYRHTVRSMIG